MKKSTETIKRARLAWDALAPLRDRRRRYKNFAYGRQWEDPLLIPDGRVLTEGQAMRLKGRVPVTNNLIRQLLKTIIGRYRYLVSSAADSGGETSDSPERLLDPESDPLGELDARALEEFLISGMALQRVDRDGACNISPERFFFRRFDRHDGADCTFLGQLHDMEPGELMRRFTGGDLKRYSIIRGCYGNDLSRPDSGMPGEEARVEFGRASRPGCLRVVEVWSRETKSRILLHDMMKGEYGEVPLEPETIRGIESVNASRARKRRPEINAVFDCREVWNHYWLAPDGTLLGKEEDAGGHPFVMRFYPYIDGEIHSLVEDVLGQQKYVNRLVTLLDDIIAHSGKGVLLFPADQLPEGFTWGDLRELWANPGGIVPYKRTSKGTAPQQVHTSGRSEGASEMLKMQLRLFDEVAGVAGSLRGQSGASRSAESLRREMENSIIGMLDILGAFREFTLRRDNLYAGLKTETDGDK